MTWVKAVASFVNHASEIWYGPNSSGSGTTVTVTYTNTSGTRQVDVSEWSDIATSSPLDGSGGTNSGSSTNPATSSYSTSNADDLVIGTVKRDTGGGHTWDAGPTNSFTDLDTTDDKRFHAAYRIVSATGCYSTDWTFNKSSTWDTAIIAFKKAAGGGPAPTQPPDLPDFLVQEQ